MCQWVFVQDKIELILVKNHVIRSWSESRKDALGLHPHSFATLAAFLTNYRWKKLLFHSKSPGIRESLTLHSLSSSLSPCDLCGRMAPCQQVVHTPKPLGTINRHSYRIRSPLKFQEQRSQTSRSRSFSYRCRWQPNRNRTALQFHLSLRCFKAWCLDGRSPYHVDTSQPKQLP